jgi:hypothetical protein
MLFLINPLVGITGFIAGSLEIMTDFAVAIAMGIPIPTVINLPLAIALLLLATF